MYELLRELNDVTNSDYSRVLLKNKGRGKASDDFHDSFQFYLLKFHENGVILVLVFTIDNYD